MFDHQTYCNRASSSLEFRPILVLHGFADFMLLLTAKLTENALFITAAIPNLVQQPPLAHQAEELASGEL